MDLWPELFELAFPRWARPHAGLLLSPLKLIRKSNWRASDAVTALCREYLSEVNRAAPHTPTRLVYNGIDVHEFRQRLLAASGSALEMRLGKQPNEVWAVFAGSLGENYDIRTIIDAARILAERRSSIRIIVCGTGPLAGIVDSAAQSKGHESLYYLGQLDSASLAEVYSVCEIGIAAYRAGSNVGMPDKAYDYLAASLPIVTSLRGELAELIRAHRIGEVYTAGSSSSLADALERLVPGDVRQHARQRATSVAELFDREDQYAQFVKLLLSFDK